MAKLVFGLNQSLDGYVDHQEFAPGPSLFRHFTEQVRDLAGSVYGRRMYEVMRYWDEDHPEWDAEERDFAAVWRSQPKWVVSRSLKSVGPNATLVEDDIEAVIRGLKAQLVGEIEVGGPDLARSLTDLGLIDEYRLILVAAFPFVLWMLFGDGPRSRHTRHTSRPRGNGTTGSSGWSENRKKAAPRYDEAGESRRPIKALRGPQQKGSRPRRTKRRLAPRRAV